MSSYHPQAAFTEWTTPPEVFDPLEKEFGGFELDVAAAAWNAKAPAHFDVVRDGLRQPWPPVRIWLNPPYGRQLSRWVYKAWRASQQGATVVALLPVRTDTRWFHDFVLGVGAEIRFLRRRVGYGGTPRRRSRAPFPSMVVVWRPAS